MKVSAQKRERPGKLPQKDDHALALSFAKAVDKELGAFVRAVVLFGSCAKGMTTPMSDIDVLIVIDDVQHVVDEDVTEGYRKVVQKVSSSKRLHINTMKLSNFWEYCREGDPVIVNMLRDGVPLIDKGFFGAAQLLLDQGRIRPSREAIWTYYTRSSTTLRSARQHVLTACVDLYWAAIDASHAALMSVGEIPPSPEHVPDLLEQRLVKKALLDRHFPGVMRELYRLQKSILHRELKDLSGEQFDAYLKETMLLIEALRTVVERHPPTP